MSVIGCAPRYGCPATRLDVDPVWVCGLSIGDVAQVPPGDHDKGGRRARRAAPLVLACFVLLAASCSSSGKSGDVLRPPATLYMLPNAKSLPQGVKLWDAHLATNETELIFMDRSACNGGKEIHLFVSGRPAGVAPRPYSPPGAFANGTGICDYGAGPRPSDALEHYEGNSLSWSGPAGIVNASGSVDRQTLTSFVRGLRAVSRSSWIAYARQAPHRSSQNSALGPNA